MFGKKEKDLVILGKGSTFTGNILSEGPVTIYGICEGNVSSTQDVLIKENGRIKGDISGDYIDIDGKVEGHIKAQRDIRMGELARVFASVSCRGLNATEGSVYKGKVLVEQ